MVTRYKINDFPKLTEVISITDLDKLKNGLLVFKADVENPDQLNDIVDMLGVIQEANKFEFSFVVVPWDVSVHEVLEDLDKMETTEKKNES